MDQGPNGVAEREQRLDELVTAYLQDLEAGREPDRQELLHRHPDLAADLAQFFEDQDALGGGAVRCRLLSALVPPEADPATGPAPAGEQLGDFRLLREVGRGGMGIVYEAEQVSLGRRVALKVLPLAATLGGTQLQRFHNEARAAAGLHHTNIVPVHFVGCERGVHFYAMQFIEGQSLAAVLARLRQPDAGSPAAEVPTTAHVPLPALAEANGSASTQPAALLSTANGARGREYFRAVADLGVQAAEALDYGHRIGVVHRDVKPGNLLLDATGRLWVTDFGLAQVEGAESLTATGELVGTLRYMSPEQALAQRVVIDHRTDVYSLGATLYELLTLRPVFTGNDRQELLRQIAFEEPVPPRRLHRAIPAELQTIVVKALEKAPQDRYATAQELAEDLRRWLDDRPIEARRPTLIQRLGKWRRRHRVAVTATAVCLLVVLAAGVGSVGFVLGERSSRQKSAESKVLEALETAAARLPTGNPYDPVLVAALERAEAQAEAGAVGPAWRSRVRQLRQDVAMLKRLDEASLQLAAGGKEGIDWAGADRRYAEAFGEYGFDGALLNTDKVVEQVRTSSIRTPLLVALDNWAVVRHQVNREQEAPLRQLAERADDDPWRQELRQAVQRAKRGDSEALAALAKKPVPPDQPPVFLFALSLHPGEAETLLRAAQQHYPGDFWTNFQLALTLLGKKQSPDAEEAIRYFQVTLALRPHSSAVHTNLGLAFHVNGQLNEAVAELQKGIELDPNNVLAHNGLGIVLKDAGRPDDAIAAFRKAIQLDPRKAGVHSNLGETLRLQGRLDEALIQCQEAIALDPKLAVAHAQLGGVLFAQGRLDEAIAECRKAITLDPRDATAHYNLGIALNASGRPDEATAAYRKAIDLKKNYAEAHCNLGAALHDTGRLAEALQELRRGHELGSSHPRWPYPSAQWVKQCEQHAALDTKLARILRGETPPADVGERLALAELCQLLKKLYATSVRFYSDAFAEQPKLADDVRLQHRYNAACAAALAGCGQGKDAHQTDDTERTRLRRQAFEWLRADLAAYRRLLEKDPEKARPLVVQQMQHWQQDKDFAGVRHAQALARLPVAERAAWRKLWQEVEDLRQRAGRTAPSASPVRR